MTEPHSAHRVSPFPFPQARQVIEDELGLTIEQLFVEFDETPITAASIGQVHRAVLPNGRRVAVKVQRPDAPRQIEADLELMYQAARLARERVRALEFIDTVALVDEFARAIRQELALASAHGRLRQAGTSAATPAKEQRAFSKSSGLPKARALPSSIREVRGGDISRAAACLGSL